VAVIGDVAGDVSEFLLLSSFCVLLMLMPRRLTGPHGQSESIMWCELKQYRERGRLYRAGAVSSGPAKSAAAERR
jgi:hypothetical protein